MLTLDPEKLQHDWAPIIPILFVPHTETQYQQLTEILDELIDIVRENESHPLASLLDVIGVLIEQYEDEHVTAVTDL